MSDQAGKPPPQGLSRSERILAAAAAVLALCLIGVLLGFANVARMLATCVLREDRSAVFDPEGWEAYGARYFNEALATWDRVQVLSGMTAEPPDKADQEKKPSARA